MIYVRSDIDGFWVPSKDTTLIAHIKKYGCAYQKIIRDTALSCVRQFRSAIDVGAHCGFWSYDLANKFDKVYAFEPIDIHRQCFAENVTSNNVVLHGFALGKDNGSVEMYYKPSKGMVAKVVTTSLSMKREKIKVEMRVLDSFDFSDVDFIKLDCEGYEYFVLIGGENLIDKCRPVICVEQRKNSGYGLHDDAAVKWLCDKGYSVMEEIDRDFILKP